MPRELTRREKQAAAEQRAQRARARQGLQLVTEANTATFARAARKRQRAEDVENLPWLAAPYWARSAYTTTRRNARKRCIPFALTKADVEILVQRCKGHCEVSGLPFELEAHATASRRPFAPSFDRINSARGYTLDNVRIIAVIANLALNEWGDETLLMLARAVVAKSGSA